MRTYEAGKAVCREMSIVFVVRIRYVTHLPGQRQKKIQTITAPQVVGKF